MYDDIKKQLKELETQMADPAIVADPEKLKSVSKKHAELKEIVNLISEWEKIQKNIKENEQLIKTEKDAQLIKMAQDELADLRAKQQQLARNIQNELYPPDPNDKKDVIMEIRAGTGGDESALFAADLFRMYTRFAEKQGWQINLLNTNRIGLGGFKEIIFEINGKNVFSALKYERGTHRVQRVPETEKAGRIHTSAVTVAVLPKAEEIDLEIKPEDLRIDTYAASGPGGQKVNTTNSAVRITHIPTGTVVQCQDQKSQQQNKAKALQVLRSRIMAKLEEERHAREAAERKEQVGSGDRSEKIRTYNFPQDRVTDHRIGKSWHGLNRIMAGEIDEIIKELRLAEKN